MALEIWVLHKDGAQLIFKWLMVWPTEEKLGNVTTSLNLKNVVEKI